MRGIRTPCVLGSVLRKLGRCRAATCSRNRYVLLILGLEVAVEWALCGTQGGAVPLAPLPVRSGGTCLRARAAPALRASDGRGRGSECGGGCGPVCAAGQLASLRALGAAGRVTRGRAPPRRRDHVGAGARSSGGSVPRGQVLRGGRHRPAGTARAGPRRRAIPASLRARPAGPRSGAAGHAGP